MTEPRGPTRASGGRASLAASVLAAALSSACCWLPLVLLTFGASAAGVSAVFERWRPIFAVVAFAFLSAGFYSIYLRRPACADGSCGPQRHRPGAATQISFWLTAALVAALVLFPRYATDLVPLVRPEAAVSADQFTWRYQVAGLTCEGCAVALQERLREIDGVVQAEVDFARGTVVVRATRADRRDQVAQAAVELGFNLSPQTD